MARQASSASSGRRSTGSPSRRTPSCTDSEHPGIASRRTDITHHPVTAGAVAMLASGCASGSTRSSGTSSTTALPAATAAQQVTVKMSEFALDVPAQTFAPGTYSFVASNVGHTVHSLEIDGTVANHKAMGMDTHITVGAVAPAAPAGTCPHLRRQEARRCARRPPAARVARRTPRQPRRAVRQRGTSR